MSFIIKLERGDEAWYLEWSNVSDSPCSYGMSLEDLRARRLKQSGTDGVRDWDDVVKRIAATGGSQSGYSGGTLALDLEQELSDAAPIDDVMWSYPGAISVTRGPNV